MSPSQWSLSPSSQDSSSSVQASVQSSSIAGSFRLRVDSCFEGEMRCRFSRCHHPNGRCRHLRRTVRRQCKHHTKVLPRYSCRWGDHHESLWLPFILKGECESVVRCRSADVAIPMVIVTIFAGEFVGGTSIVPVVIVHSGCLSFEGCLWLRLTAVFG